jgi:hypothetical protein
LLAYEWSSDRGEVDDAGKHLDRALAAAKAYPAASRPVIYLEAAYFTARYRADAATARAYLEQSKGGFLVKPYSELLAEAAVLLAEGNHATAINRAREALESIRGSGDAQNALSQLRILNEIVALCEAAMSSPEAEVGRKGEEGSSNG